MLSAEAEHTNFPIYGLIRAGIEPTSYRFLVEHAYNYIYLVYQKHTLITHVQQMYKSLLFQVHLQNLHHICKDIKKN